MKFRYIAVLMAGFLVFSTSLEAQIRGGYGERGSRGERPDRVRLHEQLDLTGDQESKLSEIRTAHQKQMIDKQAELRKLRLSIQEEMRKDNPDMTAVQTLIRNQESLRTNVQLERIKHFNDIREVLTPEQREIWQKNRREFRDWGSFGERRGHPRRQERGRW
jgi:Spy/CpxP family protein refolding chaperone